MVHVPFLFVGRTIARFAILLGTPWFPSHHHLFSSLTLFLTLQFRHTPSLGTAYLFFLRCHCNHSFIQGRGGIRIRNCNHLSCIDGSRANQGGFESNQGSSLELFRQPILLVDATKHRHHIMESALNEKGRPVCLVVRVRVCNGHHIVVFADGWLIRRKHAVPTSNNGRQTYILRR